MAAQEAKEKEEKEAKEAKESAEGEGGEEGEAGRGEVERKEKEKGGVENEAERKAWSGMRPARPTPLHRMKVPAEAVGDLLAVWDFLKVR